MKKLILLLCTPIVFLGQDVKTNEYFNDGKKIIEKTWQEDGQSKTLVEIVSGGSSEFRYYINQNDVEVGLNMYRVRDYGKYFKVDVSIINNSQKRYDFNPRPSKSSSLYDSPLKNLFIDVIASKAKTFEKFLL